MDRQQKKNIKVLVVDDVKEVRDFLIRLLSLHGLDVRAVEDGFKAIEIFKQEKVDIVFLDVKMPRLDGVETLRELKKYNPDCKYVMITGYAVDDLLEQAKKEGAFTTIKKPFNIDEIIAVVQEYNFGKSPEQAVDILVVDDDDSTLEFFRELLKDRAYKLVTVRTGSEAIAQAKDKKFDLLLLDIALKDCNGIDLYFKIKEIRPDLDVIIITGYPEKAKDALHLDIKGCFYKPFDIDRILSAIENIRRAKGL